MSGNFSGVKFLRLYRSLGTEKESRSLVFVFSKKREISDFNVTVVQ